jgi:hypothetical protein
MTSKNAYRLINPYIEGSIDTVVDSKNSFGAGKRLYKAISDHFTNHVDDFYMTIQNAETKELSHFKINEKRDGKTIDFNLVKLDDKFAPDIEKKLVANVDKLTKQSGGGFDDDSSSSDSDSDYREYNIYQQPISRFVYFYLPYYKLNAIGLSPLDASRIFMPMFGLPVNPTLEVRFDLYRYF